MRLFIKAIPLRAGTGEPVGEPRLLRCPPDVEPDTILSFLTQRLGEVIETVWTSTKQHKHLGIGWVFPDTPGTGECEAAELACIPFIESPDGTLQPMYEVQADQRQQFAQLADDGLDYAVIQQPHRAYSPAGQTDEGITTTDDGITTADAPQAGSLDELDQAMTAIARQAGATLRIYPRPGRAVRRIVLRDNRDDRGTRYLDAALEEDGTLRIAGHDQGSRVSDFWGDAITSYEWVYVVAPDRVPALIRLLGGHDGDDVLALLAACHRRAGEQFSDMMSHPDVSATFSNWHS